MASLSCCRLLPDRLCGKCGRGCHRALPHGLVASTRSFGGRRCGHHGRRLPERMRAGMALDWESSRQRAQVGGRPVAEPKLLATVPASSALSRGSGAYQIAVAGWATSALQAGETCRISLAVLSSTSHGAKVDLIDLVRARMESLTKPRRRSRLPSLGMARSDSSQTRSCQSLQLRRDSTSDGGWQRARRKTKAACGS